MTRKIKCPRNGAEAGGILRSFLYFRFEATLQDKTGHHVSDSDVPQASFEEWTSWVSPEINSTCRVFTHTVL